MPAGNHFGPRGKGPMSGRALGYCAGYTQPGCRSTFMTGKYQRSSLRHHRMHQYAGYGTQFVSVPEEGFHFSKPTLEQEQKELKAHAAWLQSQLDLINSRLIKLQDDKTSKE